MRSAFPEPVVEQISQRLTLVSSPLRIRLVDHLRLHGATSVQTLADELGATHQSVSKALQQLYRNRVVAREREGRRVWYSLIDAKVVDIYAAAIRENEV